MDVDFQVSAATAAQANSKAVWARNITDELAPLRDMAVSGSLLERQQQVRGRLIQEQRSRDLQSMLSDSEPKDKSMYAAMQAVVCILHLENRVGLKSIESILRSGFSNARKGDLEWTVAANNVNKRQDEYVRAITRIIQTQILGTVQTSSQ